MGPSQEDIDSWILASAREQWRKVAMIISRVLHEAERRGSIADTNIIAERISALVHAGQLDAQGNLSRWRFSEVRLPEQP